jgi:hypothetical protein
MGALQRYLKQRIQATTGLTSGVLLWAVIALVFAPLAIVFFILAAYVALIERYGPMLSALILAAGFLLTAIVGLIVCMRLHNRTKERAQLALTARQPTPWLDPSLLGVILQISRRLDRRWLVALLAIPLAAGVGLHWYNQRRLPLR